MVAVNIQDFEIGAKTRHGNIARADHYLPTGTDGPFPVFLGASPYQKALRYLPPAPVIFPFIEYRPPAISALEAGYEVLALIDACGSDTEIGEETSRRRMERPGVWLASADAMVAELVQARSSPPGIPLIMAMTAVPPMLPVGWSKS